VITRLARVAVRWPIQVFLVWGAIVLGLTAFGLPNVQSRLLPADLFVPGTQSFRWQQLKAPNYGLPIALALEGTPAQIDRVGPKLTAALASRPYTRVQSPFSPGAGAVAKVLRRSRTEAVFALDIREAPGQNSSTVVPPLQHFINARIEPGMRAYLSGDSPLGRELNNAGFDALHQGEIIALPLLVLILLLVFRSPVAALIPLLVAGGTVGAGMGILDLFTHVTDLDVLSLSLLSMIGLALGVDYALLLVSRFREALDQGQSSRQAATLAANTAGRTTIFAGCVLSTLMLAVIVLSPGGLLRSASIGAIISTIFAMVSGMLVVPSMLTLLGPRVNMWQIGGRRGPRPALIPRVVSVVGSRPAMFGGIVLVALLVLASPVLALKTTPPDPKQLPAGNPALVAYDQIRDAGLGPNIDIALRKPNGSAITSPHDLRAIQSFEDELRRLPYVGFVAGPGVIAPQSQLLAKAPADLAQTNRDINSAHNELNRRINQVAGAEGQLAADRTLLANGLANAQGLLNQGRALLSGVGGQFTGQLAQLVNGLGVAAAGAAQLASGTAALQSNAAELASVLGQIRSQVIGLEPQIRSVDRQVRQAQASLDLLRVPAQVVQNRLQAAQSDLNGATVGNADPAVQRAKADIAAALAADVGGGPYGGIDNSLAQAASQASAGGDQADAAIRQVYIAADVMIRVADGAARLANPGLSTILSGLQQLSAGLQAARNQVAAAAPQIAAKIASLQNEASALIAQGQAQLNAAGAQAFPQLASAQVQLLDAGNRLSTIRNQLVSRTGPFQPLRLVDQVQHESPFIFTSPYLVVAALQGTRPLTHKTIDTIVDSDTGGNVGQIVMLPNVATNSPQQNEVVSNVRALTAHFARQNGFQAAAGGAAGELVDYSSAMAARVPLIILALCVITYLLLVPILRSLILPAIAVVLNVLTVTVAMGIVTAFSVNGVIASSAPIGGAGKPDIVAVTAVFCVIFALSIDYYVFLLTRMREEYVRTQSNSQAVTFGIEKTGRIVTGAAAIMVATFFAFALSNFTIVRELGIGLCSAILIDATLVRLGLLPAVMRLFGDWTWYIPAWLEERMPTFDIEGAAFEHEAAQISGKPVPGAAGFA
jgi:RND superfamily putative drug exporter